MIPQLAHEAVASHITDAGIEHALAVRAGFLRGVKVQSAQQKRALSIVPHECLLWCLNPVCQEQNLREIYLATPHGLQRDLARGAWLTALRQCMADSVAAKTRTWSDANRHLTHFGLELLP